MIETIEFVLGTVSNTASYLRLWALSLAHGQLAEVFFNLCLSQFISLFKQDFIVTIILVSITILTFLQGFFLWPVFWSVTFAIIMCMDVMECSLHTLRLHWVEFQNKFYKGDGYKFKPYSYDKVLEEVLENE